jgi:hypothetical protein
MKTGIWLFHFSNGNTAPRNPPFGGCIVYATYTYQNFWPHFRHNHLTAE